MPACVFFWADSQSGDSSSTGIVAGAVVGGFVLLICILLLILVAILILRRRTKKAPGNPSPHVPVHVLLYYWHEHYIHCKSTPRIVLYVSDFLYPIQYVDMMTIDYQQAVSQCCWHIMSTSAYVCGTQEEPRGKRGRVLIWGKLSTLLVGMLFCGSYRQASCSTCLYFRLALLYKGTCTGIYWTPIMFLDSLRYMYLTLMTTNIKVHVYQLATRWYWIHKCRHNTQLCSQWQLFPFCWIITPVLPADSYMHINSRKETASL